MPSIMYKGKKYGQDYDKDLAERTTQDLIYLFSRPNTFAISSNAADTVYNNGRGGKRANANKVIILEAESDSGYSCTYAILGKTQEDIVLTDTTNSGDTNKIKTYTTPRGNTVYCGFQNGTFDHRVTQVATINGEERTFGPVLFSNSTSFYDNPNKYILDLCDLVLFSKGMESDLWASGWYPNENTTAILKQIDDKLEDLQINTIGDMTTLDTTNKSTIVEALNEVKASGGTYVGTTAPSNTNLLWIDTGNGGILKYYNSSSKEWTTVVSTWS